jgi:tetratricopeptide (TPR) repeat protein
VHHRFIKYLLASVALAACLLGTWLIGQAGLSRLLSEYVVRSSLVPTENQANSLAAADQAVRLAPSDPAAHRARAIALVDAGQLEEGIRECERAIALRPGHYTLWVELGRARDQADDSEGALEAFTEAARLAPHYAQPHWQLGNVLFRVGRRDEAFAELRLAALSDVTLLPAAIDLAWAAYNGDARAINQAFQPQTTQWRLALARFFAKHERPVEAVEQFRAAGQTTDEERRAFLQDLLAVKQFKEAYEVWASGAETRNAGRPAGVAQLTDGGFEGGIKFDDPGFGWQLMRDVGAVRYSLDTVEPKEGAHSLRIDFNGDYNPASPIISQLILVEPGAHYRLRFAFRTEALVTGGLPVIVVSDASSSQGRSLAESSPLPQGTTNWQDQAIEFAAPEGTSAVLLSIVRQSCGSGPCPIFGRIWLDQFAVDKL